MFHLGRNPQKEPPAGVHCLCSDPDPSPPADYVDAVIEGMSMGGNIFPVPFLLFHNTVHLH